MLTPFHLAINVTDLDQTRGFYGDVLGAKEGRSTETWVDFDFFGHQFLFYLGPVLKTESTGYVGEYLVPMPHLAWFWPCLIGGCWPAAYMPLRWCLLFHHRYALKVSRASNGRCFSATHLEIQLSLRASPI